MEEAKKDELNMAEEVIDEFIRLLLVLDVAAAFVMLVRLVSVLLLSK